jgi:hypothetical protein
MAARKKDIGAPKSMQDIEDNSGRLPTGVEGTNVPTDFYIPPATIEDVDRAVFDLFEKRLRLEVNVGQQVIPVRTIFATGERVFLVKSDKPPRDKNGAFILPIVSIRRSGLEQSKPGVVSGRGMGQSTGDITIKTRLSNRDPMYQALVNKARLMHQNNVASPENELRSSEPRGAKPGKLATRRVQASSAIEPAKELLAPDLGRNIYEIITMPFPHFFTALYDVIFWTQYTQHMNSLLERFLTSYDAQGNQFRLDTDKGYWYVAYVDDNVNSSDNFEDFTENERFVKYSFSLKVPAYLHGKERHGSGVPFRKFMSAPDISFEMFEDAIPVDEQVSSPVGSGDINKFMLSDITQLDKRGNVVESEREPIRRAKNVIQNPLGGEETTFVRILTRNRKKGETVFSRKFARSIDDVNL